MDHMSIEYRGWSQETHSNTNSIEDLIEDRGSSIEDRVANRDSKQIVNLLLNGTVNRQSQRVRSNHPCMVVLTFEFVDDSLKCDH